MGISHRSKIYSFPSSPWFITGLIKAACRLSRCLAVCSDVGSLSLSATVVLNGRITVSDQRFMVIQTRQRQLQPLQLRKLYHQLLRCTVWTSTAEVNPRTIFLFCPVLCLVSVKMEYGILFTSYSTVCTVHCLLTFFFLKFDSMQ